MSAIASHYNLAIIINEQRRGNAVRELQQDVTRAMQSINSHTTAQQRAATTAEKWKNRVSKLGQTIRRVLVPALLIATTAAVAFTRESVKEFAEFDKQLKQTFTLIPEASNRMKAEMSDDIRAVSIEFGNLTDETLPALYQALSAGVVEENSIKAVEVASRAAIAGVSDLESTMRIGMAVVNAYGGSVYSLEEAYDILFELIDKGVPRLSDWADSLQDVMSIASETQTPFEDIATALAVMTRQGDSAGESASLLGFLLMQLGVDGTSAFNTFKEAAGITYREFIANGEGLIEALILLDDYAISTGETLASMIGGGSNFYRDQQAGRGAMELTGIHMQSLLDLAFELEDVLGGMNAGFITGSDNAQFSIDKMTSAWEDLKITIGEAVWTQGVFLGTTGKELLEYATLLARLLSGDLNRQAEGAFYEKKEAQGANYKMSILELKIELEELGDLMSQPFSQHFAGAYKLELMDLSLHLAKATTTFHEFDTIMYEAGLTHSSEFGPAIKGTNIALKEYWENTKRSATQTWEILEYLLKSEVPMGNFMKTLEEGNKNAADNMTEYVSVGQEFLSFTGEATTLQDNLSAAWENAFPNGENMANMIHWVTVETHALKEATLGYMDAIGGDVSGLFSAYADFQRASGEWRQVLVDNNTEIQTLMGNLGADLDDEQKDAMWDIVRTAEEGGEAWLSSWRALQSDLTETQRYEMVARLADLMQSQDEYKGVYSGDRNAAEEAANSIIEAFGAIDTAYNSLALSIAEKSIVARFGEQTIEAQEAIIAMRVAMGEIDIHEANFLLGQLDTAEKLSPILDEMFVAYLADGDLTKIESDNIAKAIDLIQTSADTLTEEGLKALLDKMLSETGGFPKVAGVIVDDLNNIALQDTQERMDALTKEPFIPEVELNKVSFDTSYKTMMEEIDVALGPHTIVFNVQTQPIPNPDPYTPDDERATGTNGWRTVPGGHPNDSYLVGLTSGERYNVLTAGQNAGMGKQYNDNSVTNIYNNNHSAAAAAVSRAYLDTLYDKRVRRFAGD